MKNDTNWKVFDALREVFLQVPDIEKRWGMSASEAADIAYYNDEEIYSHLLEQYAETSLQNIYGESYARLGENSLFSFNDVPLKKLIEAYRFSPNSCRNAVKTDLRKATSITLPDGTIIPINTKFTKEA
jgi:hypothetical protein